MSSEIRGKSMSEYTGIDEAPLLTPAQKAYYKQNALVTAVGKIDDGVSTPYSNYNIPLSEIAPSAPVTDVTVNGSSVVSDGVAAVTVPTVPTAAELAGDGLTANAGKLDVSNKVPAPTATTDRGKVLTVNNTDAVVWATPAAPSVTVDGTTIQNGVDGLHVNPGPSLVVGSGALCVKLQEKKGLESEDQGLKVVPDTGIVITSSGGVGLDFTGADNGDVLSCVKTVDPDSGDATYDVNWVAPSGGGGGGGLSPITPTTIIPTLEDNVYKIIIPSNNAYYIATIDDTHNVEITPPTIGANEMYNVVLFVIANDFDEKQMTIAYNDYGIAPLDDESRYGYVHGHGFTQFILFGRGFTMKTAAYAAG